MPFRLKLSDLFVLLSWLWLPFGIVVMTLIQDNLFHATEDIFFCSVGACLFVPLCLASAGIGSFLGERRTQHENL